MCKCKVCAGRCAGAAGALAGVASHSCAAAAVWARRRTEAEEGDGNDAFGFRGLLMKAHDEVLDAAVCACVKSGFDTTDCAARCDVAL